MSLHDIFVNRHTDKGHTHHYGPHYERYIQPWNVKQMLEIGVERGGSLLAWRDWMPNAEIHGIDIRDEADYIRNEDRIHLHYGDAVYMDYPEIPFNLDMVVDDGSHKLDEIIACLQRFWYFVSPCGWYVIEDLLAPGLGLSAVGVIVTAVPVLEAHLHGQILFLHHV